MKYSTPLNPSPIIIYPLRFANFPNAGIELRNVNGERKKRGCLLFDNLSIINYKPSICNSFSNLCVQQSNPGRSHVRSHQNSRRCRSHERGNSCSRDSPGSRNVPRYPPDYPGCTLPERLSALGFAWLSSMWCRHSRIAVHTSSVRWMYCQRTRPAGLQFL